MRWFTAACVRLQLISLALLVVRPVLAAGNVVLYQPVPTVAAARTVANATKPYALSVTILPNSSPLYTGHETLAAKPDPQVMLIVDVEAANMEKVKELASLAIEAILPPGALQDYHSLGIATNTNAVTSSSGGVASSLQLQSINGSAAGSGSGAGSSLQQQQQHASAVKSLAWVEKVAAQPPFPDVRSGLPPRAPGAPMLPPTGSAQSSLHTFLDSALSQDLPEENYSSVITSGGCVPHLEAEANVTTNYVLLNAASAYVPVYLAKGHQEFNVTTRMKQDVTLTMEGVPGTGYVWMVDHSLTAAELKTGSIKLYPCRSSSLRGGGLIANQPRMYHLKVQPQEVGNFTLTMVHARPWDKLDNPSWKVVHFSVLPKVVSSASTLPPQYSEFNAVVA